MSDTNSLIIYALIIFLLILIISIKTRKEPFRTCYNLCKGKDQWKCGRQCDFIQTLYGGDPIKSSYIYTF